MRNLSDMKITRKQFNKAQKTFTKRSLSNIQKHAMLSYIYSESKNITPRSLTTVSPWSSYFVFFRQKAFVAMAIIVLLVSGTSYASAMSLPGDLLYDIKVTIIEPIGLTLRFGEKSKNEYRISLLQKRVTELEKLRQRGGIDENSQRASSKATNKNIKELESNVMLNKQETNTYIYEKVKIYNSLVDSELKIETNIEIDDKKGLIDALDLNSNDLLDLEDVNTGVDEKIESNSSIETKPLGL
jgi:hypothetical protein